MKYTAKFKYHNTVIDVEVESRTHLALAAAYDECSHKIGDGEIEYTSESITAFMTDEVKRLEEMAAAQ